ncbi:MAG: ATP-binding cassette domain-containing protein, partial [Calditrichaeota bacterium]|nr:ATP-binding cassette domain-containing protein [Calditrichota bacterium]
KEAKMKELQEFVQRFSANASKAKQATSRKKMLEKITLDDIKISSRKFPHIFFKQEREAGREILDVKGISKTIDGENLLSNISFQVNKGDKIAFVGPNGLAKTTLFNILNGDEKADSGEFKWGITTKHSYMPKDNDSFFETKLNLVEWLRQFSPDQEESFVRGFLGRMLFSGEESLKSATVLSGGEKMRCMLSKMMLTEGNVLILDEPTNHLDLEAITALNSGLQDFEGTILFVSQDHEFIQTVANRIIEITPHGLIDKLMDYDTYIENEEIDSIREKMYV